MKTWWENSWPWSMTIISYKEAVFYMFPTNLIFNLTRVGILLNITSALMSPNEQLQPSAFLPIPKFHISNQQPVLLWCTIITANSTNLKENSSSLWSLTLSASPKGPVLPIGLASSPSSKLSNWSLPLSYKFWGLPWWLIW